MLMYIKVIVVICLLYADCNLANTTGRPSTLGDDGTLLADTAITDSMQQQQAEYILRNKIQGLWTDGVQTDAPLMDIRLDSIYYVEHSNAFPYQLRRDSIFIIYPDWIFSGRIQFLQDTLVISGDSGITRYTRFIR